MTPEYQFWMKVLQEPKSTATPPQTIGSKLLIPKYDTELTPEEESQFQTWKAVHAPNDSGEDYDLRGAFKAGLKPDPNTGHWPDTFKKPNHPTFSNESQYAIGDNAEKAGHWEDGVFVPPQPKGAPWGWGPNHDQPNPLVITAKRLMTDARETVSDLKDEPGEVLYRIRERAKAYLPPRQ